MGHNLLNLVDALIGDVLQGNVYTDTSIYANSPGTLGFQRGATQAHNHAGSSIIPSPQHGPPLPARQGFYQPPGKPPVSVIDQAANIAANQHDTPTSNIRGDGAAAHGGGNRYDDRDPRLISSRGGRFAVEGMPQAGLGLFDVFAISHWLRNVGTATGILPGLDGRRTGKRITKGITFAAQSILLPLFNPGDPENGGLGNQILNPLSFALSNVPLLRGTQVTAITSGPALGVTYGEATGILANLPGFTGPSSERLLRMRDGLYVKAVDGNQVSEFRLPDAGYFGDLTAPGNQTSLQKPGIPLPGNTIAAQVDGGTLGETAKFLGLHTNVYGPERPYSQENAALPLSKLEETVASGFGNILGSTPARLKTLDLFDPKKFPGGPGTSANVARSWVAKSRIGQDDGFSQDELVDAPGVGASIFAPSVSVGVEQENAQGLVEPANDIPDSQNYMPFHFQDLRKDIDQFLYFRAFLKPGLAETFTTDWQVDRYYGRVDQVAIYKGTTRTINLGFDIVAWDPSQLPLMWKKIQKLQSMTYPTYDIRGFLQAGPIIRMRIGDLFSAGKFMDGSITVKKGLPGRIISMDLSYDDGIWDLKEDFKVPRKVSVTLAYEVIHDGNPGIYPQAAGGEEGVPAFGVGANTNIGGAPGEEDFQAVPERIRGVYQSADEAINEENIGG